MPDSKADSTEPAYPDVDMEPQPVPNSTRAASIKAPSRSQPLTPTATQVIPDFVDENTPIVPEIIIHPPSDASSSEGSDVFETIELASLGGLIAGPPPNFSGGPYSDEYPDPNYLSPEWGFDGDIPLDEEESESAALVPPQDTEALTQTKLGRANAIMLMIGTAWTSLLTMLCLLFRG
ncbi:hypothetical protein TWF696_000335 [Orbilia brochopaga]|uniref:Uncharacterized protein n=1 Tax=Orbilia brochopaga TaxID=3140254 RepID=A0AAV9VHD2_9PEZI